MDWKEVVIANAEAKNKMRAHVQIPPPVTVQAGELLPVGVVMEYPAPAPSTIETGSDGDVTAASIYPATSPDEVILSVQTKVPSFVIDQIKSSALQKHCPCGEIWLSAQSDSISFAPLIPKATFSTNILSNNDFQLVKHASQMHVPSWMTFSHAACLAVDGHVYICFKAEFDKLKNSQPIGKQDEAIMGMIQAGNALLSSLETLIDETDERFGRLVAKDREAWKAARAAAFDSAVDYAEQEKASDEIRPE